MAEDELAAFRDHEEEAEEAVSEEVRRELLIFELDGVLYGVPAERVSTVVAWRTPTVVPHGGPRVAGVLQDAGRIIVVLRHPAGRPEAPAADVARVLVTETRRGHIGLPAGSTRGVESVATPPTPTLGDVLESATGALTYVEPDQVVDTVLEVA